MPSSSVFSRLRQRHLKISSVQLLVYVLCVWFFLPEQLLTLPGHSIDPSWMLSLDFATHERLTFGRDWVFTYGPLGFLSTRLGFFMPWWTILIFDLFLCSLLVVALRAIFRQIGWRPVPVAFVMAIVFFIAPHKEAASMIFLFFAFFLLLYARTTQRWALLLAGFLAALVFFIKLNFGLVAPILFYGSLVYFVASRRLKITQGLVLLGLHLGLIGAASALLRVDLAGYLAGAVQIMGAFGDVMYVKWAPNQEGSRVQLFLMAGLALLVILLLGTVVWFWKPLWRARSTTVFPLLLFGILLFLYYKQGYTRQDLIHSLPFHRLLPALVGMLYLFIQVPGFRSRVAVLLVGTLIGSGAVAAALIPSNPGAIPYADALRGFSQYSLAKKVQETARKLGPSVRHRIGSATVDVWPNALDYAFYNHLNYQPRPVVQAYQSYTGALSAMNRAHLMSAFAPEFMLLNPVERFDNRYALWDDALAHQSLTQRYRLVDSTIVSGDTLLLLQRQASRPTPRPTLLARQVRPLAAPMQAPPGSDWLRLRIRNSVMGKVRKLLYQPSDLQIRVFFSDRSQYTFRALLPVLEAGVPLKKVTTHAEASRYFRTQGRNAARVTGIRLIGNPASFEPYVEAEWYTL